MIACVVISYFVASIHQRDDIALTKVPLVVGEQQREISGVYGYCRRGDNVGIRLGMPLRLAHLIAPQARMLPTTESKYLNASAEAVDGVFCISPDSS